MDRNKIKLALGIISGRVNINLLNEDEWYDLGYEPHSFSKLGTPVVDNVKSKAEDIIYEALKSKIVKEG